MIICCKTNSDSAGKSMFKLKVEGSCYREGTSNENGIKTHQRRGETEGRMAMAAPQDGGDEQDSR